MDLSQLGAEELERIRCALRAMPPTLRLADVDWQAIVEAAKTSPAGIDLASGTIGDLIHDLDAIKERRRAQLIGELTERLEQIGERLRPRTSQG